MIDDATLLRRHGLKATRANQARIARVRDAACWLRNCAYAAARRGDFDDAAKALWLDRCHRISAVEREWLYRALDAIKRTTAAQPALV